MSPSAVLRINCFQQKHCNLLCGGKMSIWGFDRKYCRIWHFPFHVSMSMNFHTQLEFCHEQSTPHQAYKIRHINKKQKENSESLSLNFFTLTCVVWENSSAYESKSPPQVWIISNEVGLINQKWFQRRAGRWDPDKMRSLCCSRLQSQTKSDSGW